MTKEEKHLVITNPRSFACLSKSQRFLGLEKCNRKKQIEKKIVFKVLYELNFSVLRFNLFVIKTLRTYVVQCFDMS
jgi:hypothetical protein